MPTEPRTEYGLERSSCSCQVCVNNCKFMPGYLTPADLDRLTPAGLAWRDRLLWATEHLRASEGARLLGADGRVYRVPTLVPAHRADFSCHWLGPDDRCTVHADAPFGCAFFSCLDTLAADPLRGIGGLVAVLNAWADREGSGLYYAMTWVALHAQGLTAPPLADRKAAVRAAEAGL